MVISADSRSTTSDYISTKYHTNTARLPLPHGCKRCSCSYYVHSDSPNLHNTGKPKLLTLITIFNQKINMIPHVSIATQSSEALTLSVVEKPYTCDNRTVVRKLYRTVEKNRTVVQNPLQPITMKGLGHVTRKFFKSGIDSLATHVYVRPSPYLHCRCP